MVVVVVRLRLCVVTARRVGFFFAAGFARGLRGVGLLGWGWPWPSCCARALSGASRSDALVISAHSVHSLAALVSLLFIVHLLNKWRPRGQGLRTPGPARGGGSLNCCFGYWARTRTPAARAGRSALRRVGDQMRKTLNSSRCGTPRGGACCVGARREADEDGRRGCEAMSDASCGARCVVRRGTSARRSDILAGAGVGRPAQWLQSAGAGARARLTASPAVTARGASARAWCASPSSCASVTTPSCRDGELYAPQWCAVGAAACVSCDAVSASRGAAAAASG